MSQSIQRGEVYVVDFDPPKGAEYKVGSQILKRRPAVIISHNAINRATRVRQLNAIFQFFDPSTLTKSNT